MLDPVQKLEFPEICVPVDKAVEYALPGEPPIHPGNQLLPLLGLARFDVNSHVYPRPSAVVGHGLVVW